jgi:hypothetical protein
MEKETLWSRILKAMTDEELKSYVEENKRIKGGLITYPVDGWVELVLRRLNLTHTNTKEDEPRNQ